MQPYLTSMAVLHIAGSLWAAPTAMTYQGHLKLNGQPVDEICDFIFRLVQDTGGSILEHDSNYFDGFADGPPIQVVKGLFSASLDFSSSDLNNDNLYLLINVRCPHSVNNSGPYIELEPMQPLSAAPYARQVHGMFIDDQDRIGIGTKTPGFPLNFPNTLGDKISLWGNSGNHYGLGIQSSLLQIHGDVSSSSIAFGHGSSTSFSETMRIKNTGLVGIGTTAPAHKLHVRGTNPGILIEDNGTAGAYLRFSRAGDAADNYIALGNENRLYFKLGGEDLMFLESSGELGLGTATPATKLHISGSGGVNGLLTQSTDATYARLAFKTLNNEFYLQAEDQGGDWLGIYQNGGTSGWKMVVEKDTGDVGIGTTNPSGRLHIVGSATPPGSLVGADNGLLLGSSGTLSYKWIQSYGAPLAINPAGNNVGIGIVAAENTLHIHKGSAGAATASGNAPLVVENSSHVYMNLLSPDASERGILFGDPANNASGGIVYNSAATLDGLQFRTNGNSTKMVVASSGNVGIGTNAPVAPLDVIRSTTGESVARFRHSTSGNHTAVVVDSLAGHDPVVYLAESGAVKWGIRSDSDASGSPASFQIRTHAGGANDRVMEIYKATNSEWIIAFDGHIQPEADAEFSLGSLNRRWNSVFATNGSIVTSDGRQKKDVVGLNYGLRELLSLRPVRYKWKNESDPREHLGLISQEVEPIVPEAVFKDDSNPDIAQGLTYTAFIPVLIKAMQEQQDIIDTQKARLDELHATQMQSNARIMELEARLQQIASRVSTNRD